MEPVAPYVNVPGKLIDVDIDDVTCNCCLWPKKTKLVDTRLAPPK